MISREGTGLTLYRGENTVITVLFVTWARASTSYILYCALQVSCPVERVKSIGSGTQVLNSVILQVTKAFSLYSDRNRCHSLTFPRQLNVYKELDLFCIGG